MPTLPTWNLPPILPKGLPLSLVGVVATIFLGIIYSVIAKERPLTGFPMYKKDGKGPKSSYLWHGRKDFLQAARNFAGPFQVMTGTGPKIVLPNRYANELRSHASLNFNKAFSKDFFVNYPGFEPFRQGLEDDSFIQEVVRMKLTQFLNLVTDDLVEETTASVADIYGENPEWSAIGLRDSILDLVARLSSRVFLGRDLCRNKRWLEIAKSYTTDAFIFSFILRMVPTVLRPIAYWFIPHSARLRKALRDARKLIEPEVADRKAAVDKALAAGQKPPKKADTIGWMHEVAMSRGRRVDYVAAQLSLTMAAIHTTSEATSQALLDICEFPEIVQPLREEIIQVIGEHGWAKTSLYKLKLMDSFLKESQRYTPLGMASMNRWVEKEVTLSDGTVLPKDSRIMVTTNFMDPAIYSEPEKFDVARFMRMRAQPGQENAWQYVTTNPEHLLFGHGQHACPGRFFASNEIKIALCHLLLKYDWRFVPGTGRPTPQTFEVGIGTNATAKIERRRRKEEINLDLPLE